MNPVSQPVNICESGGIKLLVCCIFVIFLFWPFTLRAGQTDFQIGLWKHRSFNGALILEGLYRSQETILRNNLREKPVTSLFNGSLNLRSGSYFWHPNFLYLDVDLTYNPGLRNQNYLVIPNRSETRTAEQTRFLTTFFKQRPLTLTAFYNYSHIFINRELTANVETISNESGGGLSFKNSILPVSARYLHSEWDQNELQTQRKFTNRRQTINAEASKSFSGYDTHRILYRYDDYTRRYSGGNRVHNIISSARMHNNFTFNNGKQNYWRSLIFYQDQKGAFPLKRAQVDENVMLSLPAGLNTSGFYRYTLFEQQGHENRQHNIKGKLEHRLFKSLRSYGYLESINFKNTNYDEDIRQGAIGFHYNKSLPSGRLNITFEHRRRSDNRDSQPAEFRIFDETVTLDEAQVVLLANADIDPQSILVTDTDGLIIYQENLDYIIIERGNFIEIQRLSGGQIDPGQDVLVDYTVMQNTSYNFKTISNQFQVRLNLFKRLAGLYFRLYEQNYSDVNLSERRILKTISRRTLGIQSNRGFLTGGVEFEDYNSNLLPYQSRRIYLTLSKMLVRKLNAYLSANYRDYTLVSEGENQIFTDIACRLSYQIGPDSKIGLDGGYRFQEGRGIDLDLLNLRAEYSARYRSIFFFVGLEIYRRDFLGEKINYNGGYIRFERKF